MRLFDAGKVLGQPKKALGVICSCSGAAMRGVKERTEGSRELSKTGDAAAG